MARAHVRNLIVIAAVLSAGLLAWHYAGEDRRREEAQRLEEAALFARQQALAASLQAQEDAAAKQLAELQKQYDDLRDAQPPAPDVELRLAEKAVSRAEVRLAQIRRTRQALE